MKNKWINIIIVSALFLFLLCGCSGKMENETVAPEEKAAGFEMIENSDERFLTVVVDAQEKANVTVKKTQDDSAKEGEEEAERTLALLGTEKVFGTILDEEGYYEVQVACGDAVQTKVIHVAEPSIYSLWFSF